MGSSKKHKSDRELKHKHRHRSRSRDRHQSKKRREKDEEKKSKQHISSRVETTDVISDTTRNEPASEVVSVSGDSSSLSIDDTNKLRLKLGLKPLDVGGSSGGGAPNSTEEDGDDAAPKKKEDVHVPAVNIGEIKKTAKIREKMDNQRQKRKISQKLSKIKTLGESDDDDDDLNKWLVKSRRLEKERELADKTAKMLDQMDQDFGIGNLVEEEFNKDTKKKKEYSARDLKGIQVEHDLDSFKEGQSVILTLKDHGVLEEMTREVLINPNIAADEKAAEIEELRKKKLKDNYQPYDDDEFTEEGRMQQKTVLGKYDEEISGKKKMKSFELGASGKYVPSAERELERMRSELKQQEHVLNQTSVLAKEFYTLEEMEDTKFKKVKKIKRKIRKKAILKADDLLPLANDIPSEDLRSRPKREKESSHSPNGDLVEPKNEPPDGTEEMEIDPPQFEETKILGRFDDDDDDDDYGGTAFEEDEAMNELHATLDKVRKLKQKKLVVVTDAIEKTVNHAKSQMDSTSVDDVKGSDIVLNSTSEFCRALGDIPTYGLAGNRDEERSAFLDLELELMERKKKIQDEEDMSSQWNEVDIDTKPVNIVKEENSVLDEEPAINMGLSAALQVAVKKGYIDNQVKRMPSGPKHSDLEAIHYSIEDKRYDDLDEKYRKRDRYTGMLIDFKEKEGYKPDVRLEYADDSGRLLNEKEAFRQLSHRFHGKGPGKKKTEKRMKKLEEEQLMKQMSSTDTPLNTLTLLQEKQKQERTPYVILSGNKGMSANTIVK